MSDNNIVVAVYDLHTQAEQAVKELQSSGFDMKKLSIVAKNPHAEEHVVGFYNTGDRMKHWGGIGAFWGGLWGMLFGAAFFVIPGHRSAAGRGTAGGLDRGRVGRCRGGRRRRRYRRGIVQHRRAEG